MTKTRLIIKQKGGRPPPPFILNYRHYRHRQEGGNKKRSFKQRGGKKRSFKQRGGKKRSFKQRGGKKLKKIMKGSGLGKMMMMSEIMSPIIGTIVNKING